MANVKISELPVVTSVTNSDVLPVVASTTTSQLTMTNLAKSMPQVTSSISASFATTAFTATSASYAVSASFEITYETSSSYADFAVSASYALSSSLATSSSFAISSSFATSASWAPTTSAFPFTGSAQITGSLGVTGSLSVDGTGSAISFNANNIVKGKYTFGSTYYNASIFGDPIQGPAFPAFPMLWGSNTGVGSGTDSFAYGTFYFEDKNIGHVVPDISTGQIRAGAIKFVRDQVNTKVNGAIPVGTARIPFFTVITNNASVDDGDLGYGYVEANGRNHVLTVTGSILSKDGVSLGTSLTNNHIISGSVNIVGGTLLASGLTQITGSLGVTGSVSIMSSSISLLSSSFQTSVVVGNNKGLIANYIYPVNYYNFDWNDPAISATDQPGFPHFYPAGTNPGFQGYGGVNYWFSDVNIGQSINSNKAGVVKLLRDTTTNLPDVEYFTLVSNGNNVSDFVTSFRTANGRNHTLTVTGSLLARDGVTLGTNIQNQHYLTGSLIATGSLSVTGSLAINTSGSFILPGTASTSPVAGNFYFDFTNNKLYAYNGNNWVTASLGI